MKATRWLVAAIALCAALALALAGCAGGTQPSSSASAPASASASPDNASASASSADASSTAVEADEAFYSLKVDATEAGEGVLFDGMGIAEKGETVYQVLVDANLPLAVDNSSGSATVYGIGNAIADDGKAGWLFTVNGEAPSVGADKLEVNDGDVIEWTYHADAGEE